MVHDGPQVEVLGVHEFFVYHALELAQKVGVESVLVDDDHGFEVLSEAL